MLKRVALITIMLVILAVMAFIAIAAQSVRADDRAVITFTFDDAPRSVYEKAFPILNRYKMPATVFIATKFLESENPNFITWKQIVDLDKHGWDIQCHTATHPHLTELTDKEVIREFKQSIRTMRAHGFKPTSIASPYGDFNDHTIALMRRYFKSHRTAWNVPGMEGITGLNDPYNLDFMRISAFQLQNTTTYQEIKDLIDQAVITKNWLVFYAHGLVQGIPAKYQFNVDDFANLVNYVHVLQRHKKVYVLTYSDIVK